MLGFVALVACSERGPSRAPMPAAPDKAELFGDAVLVPTRAGEVARRELAAAGEIAAAIEATRWIIDVHVDVEAHTRVVIAGRIPGDADEDAVREQVAAIVEGVLGPDDARTVVLALGRVPVDPPARERAALPLVLAAMGFGASAGIAIDRALRRRRALALARARARSRRAA